MLTMFVVSLTEGWIGIMFQGIDSKGIDQYRTRDNKLIWAAFFTSFIVIGSFFMLNLFDGIVVSNYQDVQLEYIGLKDFTNGNKI